MPETSPIPSVVVRYERAGGQVVEDRFADTFTVGRDARCNVRLDAPVVSSMHARVSRQGAVWQIQDLYSRYGLFVNGQPVQQMVLQGQVGVQFGQGGPSIVLSVEVPTQMEAAPGTAQPARASMPPPKARQAPSASRPSRALALEKPLEGRPYEADRFNMLLPDGWQDRTVYTLLGPLTDGIQHNITVSLDPETSFETVKDFAEVQVQTLEESLPGMRLLKKEATQLANGTPAYRIIFKWSPTEEQTLFQQQVYVVDHGTAYSLTASFSRKTRKTVGPQITRIMLGFEPKQ